MWHFCLCQGFCSPGVAWLIGAKIRLKLPQPGPVISNSGRKIGFVYFCSPDPCGGVLISCCSSFL